MARMPQFRLLAGLCIGMRNGIGTQLIRNIRIRPWAGTSWRLGLTNAYQIWNEIDLSDLRLGASAGGHCAALRISSILDDSFPMILTCCTPIEYPVEVALGACDFISEDVGRERLPSFTRIIGCSTAAFGRGLRPVRIIPAAAVECPDWTAADLFPSGGGAIDV